MTTFNNRCFQKLREQVMMKILSNQSHRLASYKIFKNFFRCWENCDYVFVYNLWRFLCKYSQIQRKQLASIDSFFQHLRWSVFQQRWKQSGGFDSTVWSWNSCINSLHNDLNHFWAIIDCIYCSTWILSNVSNKGIQGNRDFDSIDPRIYKRLQKLTLSALTRSPLHPFWNRLWLRSAGFQSLSCLAHLV